MRLTGAPRVPLEELVSSVDARVREEMGEAGAAMRAEDLPELTRCADTAERLGALQETLRMDATESASEAADGFRTSELDGAGSMHSATGGGGPLEIERSLRRRTARTRRMVRPPPRRRVGSGTGDRSSDSSGAPTVRPGQRRWRPTLLRSIGRLRELRRPTTEVSPETDIARDVKACHLTASPKES